MKDNLTCREMTIFKFITRSSGVRPGTERCSETAWTLGARSDAPKISEFC